MTRVSSLLGGEWGDPAKLVLRKIVITAVTRGQAEGNDHDHEATEELGAERQGKGTCGLQR